LTTTVNREIGRYAYLKYIIGIKADTEMPTTTNIDTH